MGAEEWQKRSGFREGGEKWRIWVLEDERAKGLVAMELLSGERGGDERGRKRKGLHLQLHVHTMRITK